MANAVTVPIKLVEVAERYYQDYIGFVRWYYRRRHFTLYQIVWPSNDGRYPGMREHHDPFKEWQPALSAAPGRPDFPLGGLAKTVALHYSKETFRNLPV